MLKKIWQWITTYPFISLLIWLGLISGISVVLAINGVVIGFWTFLSVLVFPIVLYAIIILSLLIWNYTKTLHFKEKLFPKLKWLTKMGFNSAIRTAVWALLGFWSFHQLMDYAKEVSGTFFMVVNAEAQALGLSCIALFALTAIKFTKAIMAGKDGKFSLTERVAMMDLMGKIIMAVHILVAVVHLSAFNTLFK